MKKTIKRLLNKRGFYLTQDPKSPHDRAIDTLFHNLLDSARGVLHIGAHFGEEAHEYFEKNLQVIFVEADPETYKILKQKVSIYPKMRAINAALGREDGIKKTYHVYNDGGLSSSFLQMGKTSAEGPFYEIQQFRSLTMRRLDKMFGGNDLKHFDFWVVDVQGYEMEVLVGSGELLDLCNVLKVESATRLLYENGCHFKDLKTFLVGKGFSVALPIPQNSVSDAIFIRLPNKHNLKNSAK